MKLHTLLKCAFAIVLCETAGVFGTLFTMPSIPTWYATLTKPLLSPPNWVFGPVWTLLYALMGVSVFLVWENGIKNEKIQKAVSVFGAQLLLNTLWSVIFFGLHDPLGALVIIICLWLTIIWTMVEFVKYSKTAAALLFPYILWVTFASYLNYALVVLN